MNRGVGEAWLISFTQAVREIIPDHILTHAPQAPYFKGFDYYINGAYVTVDQQVGDLINFYMTQFYNQVDTEYNNYT